MTKKKNEKKEEQTVFDKTCYSIGYIVGQANKLKDSVGWEELTKDTKKYTSKAGEYLSEFVNEISSVSGELTKSFKEGLKAALDEEQTVKEKVDKDDVDKEKVVKKKSSPSSKSTATKKTASKKE